MSLSLPKANSIRKYRDANEKARPRMILLSSAHLFVIRGDFVLESIARYAALVRYSEFGGFPLFGSRKCTASTGIAVGIIIHGGPLFGGGPLLGESVNIVGSTVVSLARL